LDKATPQKGAVVTTKQLAEKIISRYGKAEQYSIEWSTDARDVAEMIQDWINQILVEEGEDFGEY